MTDETLSKKELAYALALYGVRPLIGGEGYQSRLLRTTHWRELRAMIRDDYVRPSQWDRFNEVTERGP
jgi:hypothetical protein